MKRLVALILSAGLANVYADVATEVHIEGYTAPGSTTTTNTVVTTPTTSGTTVVSPSTSSTTVVKPNSTTTTVVKPDASTTTIVKPDSSTTTVVRPDASTTTIVRPDTQGSTTIVNPNNSSTTTVEPNGTTTTIVQPESGTAATTTVVTQENAPQTIKVTAVDPKVKTAWEAFFQNLSSCTPSTFQLPQINPVAKKIYGDTMTNKVLGIENNRCHVVMMYYAENDPRLMATSVEKNYPVGQDCRLTPQTVSAIISLEQDLLAGKEVQLSNQDALSKAVQTECDSYIIMNGKKVIAE